MEQREFKTFYVTVPSKLMWLFLMLRFFFKNAFKIHQMTVLSFIEANNGVTQLAICIPYKGKDYLLVWTGLELNVILAIRSKLDQIEHFKLRSQNV